MFLTRPRHRYWWTPGGDRAHLTLSASPHSGDLARTACGRWVAVSWRAAVLPRCAECQALWESTVTTATGAGVAS